MIGTVPDAVLELDEQTVVRLEPGAISVEGLDLAAEAVAGELACGLDVLAEVVLILNEELAGGAVLPAERVAAFNREMELDQPRESCDAAALASSRAARACRGRSPATRPCTR